MPSDLEAIADAKEVLIETRDSDRTVRTVIWVVAVGEALYVRSYLGDRGMWYQRALANPDVALLLDDIRPAFRAVPATDQESVQLVSEAFVAKYSPGASRDAMIADSVLHTTLRLEPIA